MTMTAFEARVGKDYLLAVTADHGMFAVFTNDEVARVAGVEKPAASRTQRKVGPSR